MKKLVVSKEYPCKACLSCVRACSEAFYKTFDPDLSCIRITARADGEPKVNSCIMCGKCARTCPEGAISQNAKGVYMVDKKKCVACGKCTALMRAGGMAGCVLRDPLYTREYKQLGL